MIDFAHILSCPFSRTLHPRDSMVDGDEAHYFGAVESFRQVAIAALLSRDQTATQRDVHRVLDFGCGYGRVARVLRAMFPEADIVAADMVREGADFCSETFTCTPYYSEADLSALCIEGSFDLIWMGSVITHLPEPKARQLLGYLADRLLPDGLLVASSHGRRSLMRIMSKIETGDLIPTFKMIDR